MITWDPADLRRIAVLRANGLGDFLFATPALRALARAFPRAEITYLGRPGMVEFVAGRYSYVHRVEAVPPFPTIRPPAATSAAAERWREPAREALAFFARHQARPIDLAIQMQGGGAQSNPFVRMLGARRSLGFKAPDVRVPLDVDLIYQLYQPEVMRYLELVSLIGVKPDGWHTEAPELPSDVERLAAVWPGAVDAEFVVIHPAVSDPRRQWPLERFAAVAERIQRRHRLPVVVSGSPAERAVARALTNLTSAPLLDLSGRLDLGALAALLRRARLVVCNDSGPSNLAYAVGAPCVTIYWCGNLVTAGPFGRRIHRPVVSWTVTCPACGSRECRCPVSFVQDASLDEALAHVDDLLTGGARQSLPATIPAGNEAHQSHQEIDDSWHVPARRLATSPASTASAARSSKTAARGFARPVPR
jgi:ADP-heptose:LPS heptosyltransferase